MLTRLFQAGADVFRLNFSHGTHEDHAARFAMIRELEERFDRPIGILADVQGPKLRVGQLLRRARVPADRPAVPARSQPDAGQCLARQPAASGDHRGGVDRLLAAAGRRQAAAARGAQARRCAGDRGGGRRAAVRPQGRQRAGRRAADPGADRQGSRRSGIRAGARRELHRPVVRAAAGGRGGGEGADRRPRLDDGEAGEAAGAGEPRRDHAADRRGDGRARRSRRGTAAGGSAAGAEAHRSRRAPAGQAGGGGDADAGKHDQRAGADARRSVRCRDRGVRRRRCGDAVGRDRRRAVSRTRRST